MGLAQKGCLVEPLEHDLREDAADGDEVVAVVGEVQEDVGLVDGAVQDRPPVGDALGLAELHIHVVVEGLARVAAMEEQHGAGELAVAVDLEQILQRAAVVVLEVQREDVRVAGRLGAVLVPRKALGIQLGEVVFVWETHLDARVLER